MIKYILTNDFNYFFKLKKNLFVFYLGFMMAFTILEHIVGFELDNNLFYMIFGLNCSSDSGIMDIVMYLINILFFTLFTLNIFNNDIKFGKSNIFLRMNIKQWLVYKIFSIFIIITIIKSITYISILLYYLLSSSIVSDFVIYFFKDILFTFNIQLLFLIFYVILRKNKLFFLILAIVLLININYAYVQILSLNPIVLILLLLILCMNLLLIRKKIVFLFE